MAKQPDQRLASTEACFEHTTAMPVSTFEDVKRGIQSSLNRRVDERPTRFTDLVERFGIRG